MKIFISHSSRQKLFVKEMKRHFPEHINLWIDDKELMIGDDVQQSIQQSIETSSDFLLLLIDTHAIQSKWVLQEIEWALKKEKEIKRNFLLPIVLEMDAWNSLASETLKNKKFLSCLDFREDSISNLIKNLMSELFACISKELYAKKEVISDSKSLKLVDEADQFMLKLADEIRIISFGYRKESPLELEHLISRLKLNNDLKYLEEIQLLRLIQRLQQQGLLPGIVYDGDVIYVEEEHYSWKTGIFTQSKKKIAKKAVSLIKSGFTVGLDAGSTTLEIAKQLGVSFKLGLVKNITIVTNSISVANELLTVAGEMGLDDINNFFSLYLTGGRIRPNTQAVISLYDDSTFHNNIFSTIGNADISFVGTNGVVKNVGFSTHENSELQNKYSLLQSSKRKVIISDPSKIGIQESVTFATFEDELDFITTTEGFEEIIAEYKEYFLTTKVNFITV